MAAVNESQVISHLLFHKALADDRAEHEKIQGYLALVKQRGEGEHVRIGDPFDRAVAIAFELVLDHHLNPWDLDLVKFSRLYLERVEKSKEIDLLTAGRLIVMAWTVLKMQSEDLRAKSEPPPAPEAPAWEDLPSNEYLTEDLAYAYTQAVIGGEAPIDEKIRHKGDRKVTLMELVEALEEARREADLRQRLAGERDAERARRRTLNEGRAGSQVHKEDQEAEIAEVWGRIRALNGHPIPLADLHEKTRVDLVTALVSVLFLARQNRVRLWQENFPYGPIFVQKEAKPDA